MNKGSVIEFDDDISAFNDIVAVTTRDDLFPLHMVRAREDEEGPPFATLSRGLISFAHTGQMSFSYAMERRYRFIATACNRMKGLRTSDSCLDEGPMAPPMSPAQPTHDDGNRALSLRRGSYFRRVLEACCPVE
jgi:hypothetical protein